MGWIMHLTVLLFSQISKLDSLNSLHVRRCGRSWGSLLASQVHLLDTSGIASKRLPITPLPSETSLKGNADDITYSIVDRLWSIRSV